ncbi:Hybrid PKS-NRPS synthetase lepA [Lasiodiplodia hormozganensis]|uniref:Hybrid PKS-NRPS synthetase lepA n=1 Tax=Lasiodiplodia hormozganensis TaxID=869390 RepID=A0AA39Y4W3_9PEZI|nr:Hybrid PKS-NRPS synthetase lepA [Lasiodiplodia hormozganensis]
MEPIAIIGSSFCFPGGATTDSSFWELLKDARDIQKEPEPDRLNLGKFHHHDGDRHGCSPVTKSYFLDGDPRRSDAAFFSISPLEAEAMDPQQRMLLETVFEASESAGYTLDRLRGSDTSVHVGVMTNDYSDIQLRDMEDAAAYTSSGTARSLLANRISYFFDLKGPSMTVDTACSSSLVALHQAVCGLGAGDSSLAIVAGCNLILGPEVYIAESKLHMLSPTGRSRMWDADADGYARGEGVAALLLKPLSQALRDKDHIEGVVRGTGVNSDGRTPGITMPSAAAQARLIRRAYQTAGLDPLKPEDRCQYFEAHGTGTPTGDPIEANAISDVFFPEKSSVGSADSLFVGSVKTVIGHLEGCAGLAGVIKVLLAMKHDVVPPNMHFEKLNPAIEPYYGPLVIPTKAEPWPAPAPGHPKRASVNSFGFGGTNAHAIIESYEPHPDIDVDSDVTDAPFPGPFVFSANSERSLLDNVRKTAEHLQAHPSSSLSSLAHTLLHHRSSLPLRTSFSATSREHLVSQLLSATPALLQPTHLRPLTSPDDGLGALAIFTGQGAQWAGMAAPLLASSPVFAAAIARCEDALSSLPEAADRPSFSIRAELLAPAESSRLGRAAVAQPAVTAVQIGLVDMLRAAGVALAAVVGHSSGEMAALYAAGVLDAADAARIAYYRGLHADALPGDGAMMAVGMGRAAAERFCAAWQEGRIEVAAVNAPASVTLSGERQAIEAAKRALDADGVFARLLRVDRAYHSKQMEACADRYLAALTACGITPRQPAPTAPVWVSSVRGDAELWYAQDFEALRGQYWVDNLVSPVLFADAVEASWTHGGPFDLVVEVGPHAALKGPVAQTLKQKLQVSLPYCSVMVRNENCVEAFAGALGLMWAHFGPDAFDFDGYRRCWGATAEPRLLKDLPSYSWDHAQVVWRESRISRNHRLRNDKPYTMLGRRCPDDSDEEPRFRNMLSLKELPWLEGHRFQGQALFPATGYISMVLEAIDVIAGGRPVKLVDIDDFTIDRALTLEDLTRPVETVCSFKIGSSRHADQLRASFTCYVCTDPGAGTLHKASGGNLSVYFDVSTNPDELPPRDGSLVTPSSVDVNRFYESLRNIGLEYSGLFRGLRSASRADGVATTVAMWEDGDIAPEPGLHPAVLDSALQSIFVAYCAPATERLWTAYLPTAVRKISVDMRTAFQGPHGRVEVSVDAHVTSSSASALVGDLALYGPGNRPAIQLEGLTLTALQEADASNDRIIFSQPVWEADFLSRPATVERPKGQEAVEADLVRKAERLALFFYRKILTEVADIPEDQLKWHHKRMIETGRIMIEQAHAGVRPLIQKDWLTDTREAIDDILREHPDQIDMRLLRAVGDNLPGVFRGERQILEVLFADDMLTQVYLSGLGLPRLNAQMASYARQITHRYPNVRILELGAGTGATTKALLERIDGAFSSYTFTDVSAGFFPKAKQLFAEYGSLMVFQTLDIGVPVHEQGFKEHTYDIVLASNVLHITDNLEAMLQRVRKLLKPGGYLLAVEPTSQLMRVQLIMGGLEGWWLGGDDGRRLSPAASATTWDEKLRNSGFSGIDVIHNDNDDERVHYYSSFVSQAVDTTLTTLLDPLASLHTLSEDVQFALIGGSSLSASRLVRSLRTTLSSYGHRVLHFPHLQAAGSAGLSSRTAVLCLAELDSPLFLNGVDEAVLEALKKVFERSKAVLWLTREDDATPGFSKMMVGLSRGLRSEMPSLKLQILDLDGNVALNPSVIAENFLRFVFAQELGIDGQPLLWTTEPELALRGDALLIPRVRPDQETNDRLNSSRRRIFRQVIPADEEIIRICPSQVLKAVAKPKTARIASDQIEVTVKMSTLAALPGLNLHLCLGKLSSGESVLALSRDNSSTTMVPAQHAISVGAEIQQGQDALSLMAAILAALTWMHSAPSGSSLWLHDCTESIGDIFEYEASKHMVRVFRTTSASPPRDPKAIYIHPRAPLRTMGLLPDRVAAVIVDGQESATEQFLSKAQLLVEAPMCTFGSVFNFPGKLPCALEDESVHMLLKEAVMSWTELNGRPQMHVPVLATSPNKLDECVSDQLIVVDWTGAEKMQVCVEPVDPTQLFASDKTYLLVGLTTELGRSICGWMIANGARNLVLTSRAPQVDDVWLQAMSSKGARVLVLEMDVADWESVANVGKQICSEMPPVAGVCNGAMVLSDKTFTQTNLRAVEEALQPKVHGSIHLDRLFSEQDLDFFIMLSSLGSVIGTPGQTNYHMANMFMAGLAESRRRKGLAASVLDVGMVADIGYVTRQNPSVEKGLRRMYFLPLSEQDVHFMFAEAIVAGRPDATRPPELITGLRISEDDSERPFWAVDPRLSFFVREARTAAQAAQDDDTVVDLAGLLNAATDGEAALAALQEAFIKKLKVLLQLQTSSIDTRIPLVGYGVDSLLAMEIRTWFLKETDTDIPVLHIINGASAEGICRAALDQFASKRGRDGEAPKQEPDSVSSKRSSSTSTDSNAPTPPSSSSPSPQPQPQQQQKRRPAPKPRVVRTAPLSPAQSRIWFLQTFLSDPTTYNETLLYSISGPLDARRFAAAFRATVARHAALRTAFSAATGRGEEEAVQSELDAPTATLRTVNLGGGGADDDADADAAVQREFEALATRVWELGEGVSLGGVLLLGRRRDDHAFILGGHHLVLDGVSWARLVRDLDAAYRGAALPPAASYVDYAIEQRQALAAGRWEQREMAFWRGELAPLPAPLPLLSVAQASARRAADRYDTAHAGVELGADAVAAVRVASGALRVTPFHFHLGVLQVLVSRLAGVSELCVGVVDAGRADRRYLETVGFFVNVVPVRLRTDDDDDDTFDALARRAADKALQALAHAEVPMDAVLDELKVPRSATHSPLFQVVINYRLGVLAQETIGDCRIEYVRSKSSSNPYDLTLDVTESAGGTCMLSLTGQDYLYPTHACQLLLDAYVHLLRSLSENPRLPVAQCRLYGARGLDEAVQLGRGPRQDESEWPDTISRRVEQVAASMPDNTAVQESDGRAYTYATLAQKADSVAEAVADAASLDGTTAFVCLLFDPSAAFIWSLVGTLKTPAVAVPLDATMPRERLLSIVQDCKPAVILCHAATLSLAAALALPSTTAVIDVSTLALPAAAPVPNTSTPLAPALAYYTSGTTGQPKGVLVTQSAYRHNMLASTAAFDMSAADTVLQQSSHAFDMSALQIFVALSVGARLAIVPRAARGDPSAVAELLHARSVTTVLGTPAEWTMLFQHAGAAVRRCTALRCVAIGGEAFAVPLIAQFRRLPSPPPRLFNMYGPTETSMISNAGELRGYHHETTTTPAESANQRLGVGRTLSSYSVYVLDAELHPVPPGFPGEICIGGAGVGLGYLNQPDLSAAAFVRDPFATADDVERGWTRMYRTGDRGMLRPDGSLVVLGRMDGGQQQVKIRGLRIELDDVAANIVKASDGKLAHAAVVVKGEGAEAQVLVGYAAFAAADVTAGDKEKKRFLAELVAALPVPEYMRPAVIVAVERLPMNAQGKVDRAALAALEAPMLREAADIALDHLSPLEAELWSTWQTVLPTAVVQAGPIHSGSDFFRLGGNSMLLVALQKAITERWQVKIPLLDMFQASTLGQLAARIASGQKMVQDSTHKAFWDDETRFDLQESTPDPRPHQALAVDGGASIILTGATGLLGSVLLRLLLDDASVSTVHCLAVSPDYDRGKLPQSEKLTIYTGSLGDPNLGLTPEQEHHLSTTATAILHAGAEGSCLNTYASLRAQNVESTKYLAALALRCRHIIPLHYVSSARVVLLSGQTSYPPASVSSFYPAPDGDDQVQDGQQRSEGFTATKWASEAFLEKCADATGLSVAVHRSGYLISEDAADPVNTIHAFSKKLGVVPALDDKFEGYLDFCDVANVAREIAQEVVRDAERVVAARGGGVRFIHHTDDCAVPMGAFREYMQRRYGMPFAVSPMREWVLNAKQVGMSEFLASFLLAVDQKGEGIRYPRLLKE